MQPHGAQRQTLSCHVLWVFVFCLLGILFGVSQFFALTEAMFYLKTDVMEEKIKHSYDFVIFPLIPYTLYRPSPGINQAPIARMKMILIPIESLYKNLQF